MPCAMQQSTPTTTRRTFTSTALAAAGLAASRARQAAAAPSDQSARAPLGINVSGLHDWASEIPFIDVFKQSRAWLTGGALFMHLGSCAPIDHIGNARFGTIEYLGQPRSTAPKYNILMRWIEGS